MKHDDIPGWCDFESAYDEVVARYDGGLLIEVGTYLGRSLCYLGQKVKESGKPFHVVGIDTCTGSGIENGHDHHLGAVVKGGGTFAGKLHRNIIDCGLKDVVSVLIVSSLTASQLFANERATMVFLDSSHEYEHLKSEIMLWQSKVMRGGILGGDDIGPWDQQDSERIWPGVKKAVNEMLPGWEYWSHDSWRYFVR